MEYTPRVTGRVDMRVHASCNCRCPCRPPHSRYARTRGAHRHTHQHTHVAKAMQLKDTCARAESVSCREYPAEPNIATTIDLRARHAFPSRLRVTLPVTPSRHAFPSHLRVTPSRPPPAGVRRQVSLHLRRRGKASVSTPPQVSTPPSTPPQARAWARLAWGAPCAWPAAA